MKWAPDRAKTKLIDTNDDSSVDWESQSSVEAPQSVVWTLMPASDEWIDPTKISRPNAVVWKQLKQPLESLPNQEQEWVADRKELQPEEAAVIESEQPKIKERQLLADPPKLQTLDRSIAFNNGFVGPDISWNIPNGLRWSQEWFASASILGQSRRNNEGPFVAWNDGDAVAIIHANVIQTKNWSFGVNTSFRSVYQGSKAGGGSTEIGEGISSGFRIAKQLGDTAGFAFGGEQVIQWDDRTDTGRNLYLMATKGWWLGAQQKTFPLLLTNIGIGTGRFANQDINSFANPYRFGCIKNFESREETFRVDNDLCWSPIGSTAIVINPWWSIFTEYRSGTAQAATSVSLNNGLPIRLTWGVNFLGKNEYVKEDNLTWIFKASLGF